MSPDMQKARQDVVIQLDEHLRKADGYTKQEILRKLVAQLPDNFVTCLQLAYDLYKPVKANKEGN